MANIKSFPNNQDEYRGAETVMKWLHGRTSGVFAGDNNAAVAAVQGAMAVTVSDGLGWMSNSENDGVVWWNDIEKTSGAKLQLAVEAADSALDRVDRVIVEWKTTTYVDLPEIKILKGVTSSTATAAELTNNSTVRQISLARVNVAAGTTEITPSMITDERLDASVCGLVTEYINIDTSMMQNQFESLLKAVQDELTSLIGGTGFDPAPVRLENVTITPAMFATFTAGNSEETKLLEMGYEYRAAVVLSGVLENMTPYLTFSRYDVEESGVDIVNQFRAYNGGVYIYADGIPDKSITVLTAEFRKAVS